MEKVLNFLKLVGASIALLLMIGFSIGSSTVMPENAQVYVDDSAKTYIAPPCMEGNKGYRLVTAGVARKMGYKPDSKSRNEGAFSQDGRSLTGMLFEKVGVLKPIPSRWNEDGSWNY